MRIRYLKITLVIILTLLIFWPTLNWMKSRFEEPESFYAHGFLVPFVAGYLIFRKKEELIRSPKQIVKKGLILAGVFLFIHLIAYYFDINFLSGFAFIGTIVGLVYYNYGLLILRQVTFPLFFMLFMVPLPQAATLLISFKMKMFATNMAAFISAFFLNIPLKSAGSIIYLPNGTLTVGNPCSGLKSLMTLMALCLLFAYLSQFRLKKKILFFMLTIPIALLANILRIVLLIFVFYVYGQKAAMGWFHDFSGFLLFVFAFLGLIIMRKLFMLWPEK